MVPSKVEDPPLKCKIPIQKDQVIALICYQIPLRKNFQLKQLNKQTLKNRSNIQIIQIKHEN